MFLMFQIIARLVFVYSLRRTTTQQALSIQKRLRTCAKEVMGQVNVSNAIAFYSHPV
jgi:hypothetical protein